MYTAQDQPHYAPTSVGALMDPLFLRRAVDDASAQGFPQDPASRLPPARWRAALKVAFSAWLHRWVPHH